MALESDDISSEVRAMIGAVVDRKLDEHAPKGSDREDWDLDGLKRDLETAFIWPFDLGGTVEGGDLTLAERVKDTATAAYDAKQKEVGYELIKNIERNALLYVIDNKWRDHLYDLDSVKAGIGLRAYGQRDPLLEYKGEAFNLFIKMLDEIDSEAVSLIFHGRWVRVPEEPPRSPRRYREVKPDIVTSRAPEEAGEPGIERAGGRAGMRRSGMGAPPVAAGPKAGRNDPCPCGSGKKYKKCCGK
jgi:preprotein translocase subunit SecA